MGRIHQQEGAKDGQKRGGTGQARGQREEQPDGQAKGDCTKEHVRLAATPAALRAIGDESKEGVVDGIPSEFAHQQGRACQTGVYADDVCVIKQQKELDGCGKQ